MFLFMITIKMEVKHERCVLESYLFINVVSYFFAKLKNSFEYQKNISFIHNVTATNIMHFLSLIYINVFSITFVSLDN